MWLFAKDDFAHNVSGATIRQIMKKQNLILNSFLYFLIAYVCGEKAIYNINGVVETITCNIYILKVQHLHK